MTPEPEWVDLGLPSGVKWAKANLGASLPESPGIYFSWGNTEGHPSGSGYDFSQEVYDTTPAAAITEDLSIEQDAARAILGAPWRMPTDAEFQELFDNCAHEWTTVNGMYGILFTSNVNGKTLFFPAAGLFDGTSLNRRGSYGYYWSSTFYSATQAVSMRFETAEIHIPNYGSRRVGYTVRAVRSA